MRSLLLLLLSAFAFPTLAEQPQVELDMSATGEIFVAPDGSVASYVLDPGMTPVVQDLIERNVRSWRFEPIVVGGQARSGRTRMNLGIRTVPDKEGNYAIRVESVHFGQASPNRQNRPPRYPREAASSQVGARLLLIAKLDEQGHVVDLHPYQTSLDRPAGNEGLARQLRKMFERAGMAAARDWKFTPGEMVGGEPIATSVLLPIVFRMKEPGQTYKGSDWKAYVPGPISPAPWVTEASLASVDSNALGDNDSASLDSRFKLTSDVLDKAL